MGRLLALLLAVLLVAAVVGAACFGLLVLAGLGSTAGDKYGPWARAVGFAGILLLGPAFKLGAWVARRRARTPPGG